VYPAAFPKKNDAADNGENSQKAGHVFSLLGVFER
jgi:hypothetical protein